MSNVVSLREVKAELADAFDRFIEAYPRKASIGEARRAWMWALALTGNDPEVIIAGAKGAAAYHAAMRTELQFIQKPARWLQAEGWHDVYEAPKAPVASPQEQETARLERLAMMLKRGGFAAEQARKSMTDADEQEIRRRGYLP